MARTFKDILDSSLTKKLREVYQSSWTDLCDLEIECGDSTIVPANKLLMLLRSEYFAALFRQEPDTKKVSLPQFDSELVKMIVKSTIDVEKNELEQVDLVELLRASDFLQMPELTTIVSMILSENVFHENAIELCELTQMIQAPELEKACIYKIKDDMYQYFEEGALDNFSSEYLKRLFTKPWSPRFDDFGRQLGVMETTEILLSILFKTMKVSN